MVKNIGGGKHKGQARKFVNNSKSSNKLRTSTEEGELYAQVTKMLGNGMCNVQDVDGKIYLCIIRGKFRGRGKRDNTLKNGSWVLIGLRDFETKKEGKDAIDKCDLLEVYSDADKERLKNNVDKNWNLFITNDCNNIFIENTDEMFKFSNEDQQEYNALMKEIEKESKDINEENKVIGFTSYKNKNKDEKDYDSDFIDDI